MEISTLAAGERPALLDLLDLWPQPDGWSGPGFFRRYIEDDPSFVDQNYWVARDGGAPVACVQIFPRRIRLLGHSVPMGGIGSVFTHPDHRRKGLATELLGRAAAAMREAGMELSLLFSDLHDFYGQWGWRPLALERSILRRTEAPPVAEESSDTLEIALFDRNLDYEAVKALYGSYSAARNCTVVRQGDLWDASFALAGNPREEFMVARRAGTPVAYMRAAVLNHRLCITELARADDASGPMAALVAGLLNPREPDGLAPQGTSSAELRDEAVLPAFDDIALAVALEHRGVKLQPIEDRHTMLRCLNLSALAQRLNVRLLPAEDANAFLDRILPPDSLVFWPSDRF
jgi:GNAT superfamily N-acetyltransferase